MAGKGDCEALKVKIDRLVDLQKNETDLFAQRLAYDILSLTLPLCGLPKEVLKSKERKENDYDDIYYECKVSLIVLTVSFSMRDQWKLMFESRFRSSGTKEGMFEKIDDYLKKFLIVSREFKNSNTLNKINISLAAYNEIILFLNYKGIELDFEHMIVSWQILFNELIGPLFSTTEPMQKLFIWPTNLVDFFKWMRCFMKDVAIPYGRSNEVSEIFGQHLDKQLKIEAEETLKGKILSSSAPQTTNGSAAKETEAILSQVYESFFALPDHRESLEVCCTKNGVNGKDRESRIGSAKPIEPLVFDSLAVLPDKIKSSEPPESRIAKNGGSGKDKESSIPSTGSKDVAVKRRRPTVVESLLENLRRLNLTSPQENNPKD